MPQWPPPSYDPQTELFYLNGTTGYGMAAKQYLIVGAGDTLYAFTVAGKR